MHFAVYIMDKTIKPIERVVLVVDDQYGNKDFPRIEERYGSGRVQGYRFELEDAYDGSRYSKEKVLQRVKASAFSAILLDLDFGFNQKGYGYEICGELKMWRRHLPILAFSSADDKQGLALLEDMKIRWGVESVGKCPSPDKLKSFLEYSIYKHAVESMSYLGIL
jgi:hypothetical protein